MNGIMNSTPPPLPPAFTPTPGHRAGRGALPALLFLALGMAPALIGLFLIFFTHTRSSSVDLVLRRFFIADTLCALVSAVGIALTVAQPLWLRLLIAVSVASGLWGINALVGLFAGCALTVPGR